MKPNILVLQPSLSDSDLMIDHLCESLAETHYVYLVRPLQSSREDSPQGVRFLNFSPGYLPGFGEVETVILVDDLALTGRVREKYPMANHWHVDSRVGDYTAFPDVDTADTIVEGDFGPAAYQERARAV